MKNNRSLTMNQILYIISDLAHSKGFYGRLLRDLINLKNNDPERFYELADEWEGMNFKSSLDFILWLES